MADSHREEIAKLETLYANNPEGRVFTHLAEAYRKAGELDRAREILEDGLRRHSDYSSAHVVMGRVLTDQGQPDAATAAFRRVLELDRHNLVALRSLGEIASRMERIDEALHYYRELLSVDPSDEAVRGTVRALEERREIAAHTQAEAEAEPEQARPPEAAAAADAGWTAHQPIGAEDVSENWEDDVGIELEPMPGDLGAMTDEPSAQQAEPEPAGEEVSADDEWAISTESFMPPAGLMASGLDLGIDGEEIGRFELPVSDLDLSEPTGAELAPFEQQGGPFGDAEPDDATPFDLLEVQDGADLSDDAVFGAAGTTDGFDIDVGPVLPEFGGVADERIDDRQPLQGQDDGLVTETMAELYFNQGFYDRAADVYRSLLRDRPGDVRLEQRLAESQSMSAWPQADAPAHGADEPGEAWLEGVESAWTGGGGVAGGEATPYAWAEPSADEVPAGPRVGEFFRSLLAWRPGTGQVAEPFSAGAGPGVIGDETAQPSGEQVAYGATETGAPAYLPPDALEEVVGAEAEAAAQEPWDEPETVRTPEAGEAASAAGADEEGAGDDEDLEMFRSWLQSLKK